MIITRRAHPLVKELRGIRDKPHPHQLFLEGPKLVEEALKSSIVLQTVVVCPSLLPPPWKGRKEAGGKGAVEVSESIFRSVSDVEEPQGILGIGKRPDWNWDHVVARLPAPVIVLDGLQNPGNVASIVRTAEAAGASGVVTTPGTARLTSPKALRGAMGSSLRVPSLEHVQVPEIAERLARAGYRIYGTLVDVKKHPESVSLMDVSWAHASAIVFGQEGGGLSAAWSPFLHQTVRIPMQPPVDSLNVGAAAAVILYEAYRQRQLQL